MYSQIIPKQRKPMQLPSLVFLLLISCHIHSAIAFWSHGASQPQFYGRHQQPHPQRYHSMPPFANGIDKSSAEYIDEAQLHARRNDYEGMNSYNMQATMEATRRERQQNQHKLELERERRLRLSKPLHQPLSSERTRRTVTEPLVPPYDGAFMGNMSRLPPMHLVNQRRDGSMWHGDKKFDCAVSTGDSLLNRGTTNLEDCVVMWEAA